MKLIGIIGAIAVFLIIGGSVFVNTVTDSDPHVLSKKGIHWHSQLEVYINGVRELIPANIGMIGGMAHPHQMHTHAQDHVIHMEFQGIVREEQTYLGEFFKVWGKDFSSTTILGNVAANGKTITMSVNGAQNTDFENYAMKDGDKIEIRFE